MTKHDKPTWLRDAERWVRNAQVVGEDKDGELQRLTGIVARLTEENLALGGKQGIPKTVSPRDEAAENAALELKESRELAEQEPKP